eukprot:12813550-Alexandrium_andersonii.AAC.1
MARRTSPPAPVTRQPSGPVWTSSCKRQRAAANSGSSPVMTAPRHWCNSTTRPAARPADRTTKLARQ